MVTALTNGRIILPERIATGTLVLQDGKIKNISDHVPAGAETIDCEGCYVSPGFIDMHSHGAGGADFMDGTVEAFLTAARMHAKHGTTLLFPTTLASNTEGLMDSLSTYRTAKLENREGAAFGGMHLEGPYFSPKFAGAQDPRYIKNPDPSEYMKVLDNCPDIVRWSFAPELEGAAEFAAELRSRGIVASIGHTDATFGDCDRAYRAGATLMTHFYSCMSTISRRNAYRYAGTIEYGYWQDGMDIEIIADGVHVPSDLLKLLLKIKGSGRISLVTDSMRAAGMPEGKYILGSLSDGQEVIVEDGVAKLPDRSAFAGSVATADKLVRTMVREAGCSMSEAVMMISGNPARVMGLSDRKGSIEPGKDADIVVFDDNVNVVHTIVGGRKLELN